MTESRETCPECGYSNPIGAGACHNCGAPQGDAYVRLAVSTIGYSVVMAVFIGIAAVLVGICFFKSDISDIDRTVLLVTSAVSAVFARIAQAGAHHIKLTYLLERRLSRR